MTRKTAGAVVNLARIFGRMIDAHIPMCVWLDFSTLRLYRTRH